jgi:methionyl-tRNA synthetase
MTSAGAKPFYITTTLPYVNADPHIGFALEMVQADALARYHAQKGERVFSNTGTDEHGNKILEKAMSEGRDVQEYVDFYAARFKTLKSTLNLYLDIQFIRTTDEKHVRAAQKFWELCDAAGDIYKKTYQSKYCTGCELEKTDSELDEKGECPIHPGKPLQLIDEENYFFRYSKYEKPLLEFFESHPDFIVPDFKYNEIKKFVEGGLQDFSISRLKSKMSWGIPVPGDEDHVMYVWFDALVNYISTLGWGSDSADDMQNFADFWPGTQVAGKDQVRMQAGMWQAMLMSAGVPNTKQIFFHGFLNIEGQKISKSIGNVVHPQTVVDEYGSDALRYYLLREVHPYEDGDYSAAKFKETYNANLANGIGNLTSRILKMAVSYEVGFDGIDKDKSELFDQLEESLAEFNFSKAMDKIWHKIGLWDAFIQTSEPFKVIKTDPEKAKSSVKELLCYLYKIAYALAPFLPETSEKIISLLESGKFPEEPLFLRKD